MRTPEFAFGGTRTENGKTVAIPLTIKAHDDNANSQFRRCWDKMRQAIKNFHECTETGESCPSWAYWNVLDRLVDCKDAPDRLKYAAWDGDTLTGFVHVRPNFQAQPGKSVPVLYVENMATAPGQHDTELWGRKGIHNVGAALLAFCVLESRRLRTDGLIGLHADTDSIAGYYRKLAIGGTKVFENSTDGVCAPAPQGDSLRDRKYFQSTPDGSAALLDQYRNG